MAEYYMESWDELGAVIRVAQSSQNSNDASFMPETTTEGCERGMFESFGSEKALKEEEEEIRMAEYYVESWDELGAVVRAGAQLSQNSNVAPVMPETTPNVATEVAAEAPPMLPPSQTSERRRKVQSKRITWTIEEHRLFLEGLDKYEKGDWKTISQYIRTKTATQVASHAQKYFLRQSRSQEQKKRKSIHDMVLEHRTNANIQIQPAKRIHYNPQQCSLMTYNEMVDPQFSQMQPNGMNSVNNIDPIQFNQMQPPTQNYVYEC